MTCTRGSKRQKPAVSAPCLTEAQVLQAVDAREAGILQQATTVSVSTVLRWLQEDLGLADVAALRPHRHAVKQRCLQLLEHQGLVPQLNTLPGALDLPAELLLVVFSLLDHDSLFCALQACKAWHAVSTAAGSAKLWEAQCLGKGWVQQPQPQPVGQQLAHRQGRQAPPAQHGQQQQQGQPQPDQQLQAELDWREQYRQRYQGCCYDCFQPTQRHTLVAGTLRLRLCHDCSASYDSPRPQHRLLSTTTAKRQCCLKDAELDALPRCVEPNPVHANFDPMHLFRKLDVRRAAVARWGSWEAVQKEHRRRITRG